MSCAGYSTQQVDGSCLCDANYGGIDCTSFVGACSPICEECYGPSDFECVRCEKNAFRDAEDNGRCVCYNGYSGPSCMTETDMCADPHCILCETDRDHIDTPPVCIRCANGYYVDGNGDCQVCDDSCKTCSGPADNQCTTCLSGRYLDASGMCLDCHITCLECSGPLENECVACLPNSYIEDSLCKCNLGLKRHPTTLICDWECPNGFEANLASRLCEKVNPHPLELIFTEP